MAELDKIRKKRSTVRALTTKLISKIELVFYDEKIETNIKLEELKDLNEQLLEKCDQLKALDAQIENLIGSNEIENEIIGIEEYSEKIIKWKGKITRLIKEHVKSVSDVSVDLSPNSRQELSHNNELKRKVISLPKLTIPKFNGDPSSWIEFWQQFKNAIHENDNLSKTEKFSYLKMLLEGVALNAIKGFSLTEENYIKSINLLTDRFGRDFIVINSHMTNLLNLHPVKSSTNIKAFRRLFDDLEINVRSLESLNVAAGTYGQLLCPILLKLIPDDISLEYNRQRKSNTEFDVLELMQFLKREIECRESSILLTQTERQPKQVISSKFDKGPNYKYFNPKNNPTVAFASNVKQNCVFCYQNHESFNCNTVPSEEKRNKLRKEGRCFKCFKRSHLSIHCRSRIKDCSICKGKNHHEIICFKTQKPYDEIPNSAPEGQTVISSIANSEGKCSDSIILPTCAVEVQGPSKSKITAVLFDSASSKSFITKACARELKLPILRVEHLLVYTFGSREPINKTYDVTEIELNHLNNPERKIKLEVYVTDTISHVSMVTSASAVEHLLKEFKIPLQQFKQAKGRRVEILIGADVFWKLQTGHIRKISKGLFCIETLLGFIISGVRENGKQTRSFVNLCLTEGETLSNVVNNPDSFGDDLNTQLKRFWELESLGINSNGNDNNHTSADVETLKGFEQNIKVIVNGKYEVKLPFKDKIDLSDNFSHSKRRLSKLLTRLDNEPSLYEEYKLVFADQINSDVIEPVNENFEQSSNLVYYMPHHPVIRRDKETTKFRIVFDASAKDRNCLSLNDNLLAGPNLNPNLLILLLKFREHKIGVIADIEKAFLQISLSAEDRDCQRFLWVDNLQNKDLKCFRYKTVTFGVKSSTYLLAATIKHHLKNYEFSYPTAFKALNESLYVDDFICGSRTVNEALSLSKDAKFILSDAKMNLRKWKSNSKELCNIWNETKFEELQKEHLIPIKVLGIIWNVETDDFKLDLSPLLEALKESKNTKRSVLKLSCKLFDPIGFITAFTIRIKILLQEIWERGQDWDEELQEELRNKWNKWCLEIPILEKLSVPRWYFLKEDDGDVPEFQVHVFCDASEVAYGAVSYLRFRNQGGSFEVTFVAAKSRVAPVKKLSLPRLELMATLIGARLLHSLKEVFDIRSNYTLWSDSTIALHWVKGNAKQWKPFVCNRVSEIQGLTEPSNWKHCSGKDNPADMLSRGCLAEDLLNGEKWWKGPKWLILPMEQWPNNGDKFICEDNVKKEKRLKQAAIFNSITAEGKENPERILDLKKYSSIQRVYRITAWVKRFTENSKFKDKEMRMTSELTAEEILDAERLWIRNIQAECFPVEFKCLKEGNPIPKNSSIRDLNPCLDNTGIMVVGGRLQNSKFEFRERHPWLIPSNSRLTELIVMSAHNQVMHLGVASTLSKVRETFWIPRGRQIVKTFISRCMICRKFTAKAGQQITAPLPSDRVTESPPFAVSGLDFAGPLYIKVKNSAVTSKCYILLCTCAVTRAVHLELVQDLSTESFLLAFRRFVARRGLCSVVFTDNAQTFKRAEKELGLLWNTISHNDVKTFYSSKRIEWKYIVPRAAWWGGFWERMVKTVKSCLRKVLGKSCLTSDELETILVEIESVINCRPISYLYSKPNEPSCLTPAHFLTGERATSLPPNIPVILDKSSSSEHLNKKYYNRQRLLDHFWRRWKREYMLDLRSLHSEKRKSCTSTFKENDLVLIHDERVPRTVWKIGRVIETIPGRDGKIRSCNIKTSNGTLKRPIQLLYNLEIAD